MTLMDVATGLFMLLFMFVFSVGLGTLAVLVFKLPLSPELTPGMKVLNLGTVPVTVVAGKSSWTLVGGQVIESPKK